jgi:hypothetical protein
MVMVWSRNILGSSQWLGCWCCPQEEEREKKRERGAGWAVEKEIKLGLAKENWAARRRKRLVASVTEQWAGRRFGLNSKGIVLFF